MHSSHAIKNPQMDAMVFPVVYLPPIFPFRAALDPVTISRLLCQGRDSGGPTSSSGVRLHVCWENIVKSRHPVRTGKTRLTSVGIGMAFDCESGPESGSGTDTSGKHQNT